MKYCILLIFSLLTVKYSYSQTYLNPQAPVESRVADLLSRMTLEEKLNYIGGYNSFFIMPIQELEIPPVKMSDGPLGVRTWGNTTAYTAGILNSATWNKNLVNQLGMSFGNDAQARGVNILLAPGLNIYRAPMCGRNFEYYGEDPYLSAQMAVQFITGVQSKGVICTAKHFACNNQEYDRYNVSSDVDERTLQEIYLPAFKASVKEAHAGAVMAAYNLVNGEWCSQNNHLLNEILKGEWEFDGFVMSDWGATHNGLAAAQAGLDLEMPSGVNMNETNLMPLLANGTITESLIDEKVQRILRILFRFGSFDSQVATNIPLNNPASDSMALRMAREGIVLLKNQDSILPLNKNNIHTIAVIGPNDNSFITGGGSSYPTPFIYTTVYQGIVNKSGGMSVLLDDESLVPSNVAATSIFYTDSNATQIGLTGDYYLNMTLTGTPRFTRTDTTVNFNWNTGFPNVPGFPATQYSIRWTGYIKPSQTGKYTFVVDGDDGYRLSVGGQLIINDWQDQAATINTDTLSLVANTVYPVVLDYYQDGGVAEINFGWQLTQASYTSAVQKALGADVAIICAGFNSTTEGEGFDRSFQLPNNQDSLINAVAKVNPNTIVILNAGGNVDMSKWLQNVKGLIHAWYPGQEGGNAIAEILFGITNPSGKLPASFEKKWADNPVYNSYYDNGTGQVVYSEKLMLGYRYYDTENVDPLFPFGFGLSYTSFAYSNLKIFGDSTGKSTHVTVNYDIQNIGSVYGGESSQVYISQVNPPVIRPLKELKGFSKVFLQPGQKQTLTVSLDSSSFAYYRDSKKGFGMDYSTFKIIIGASSRDIRLTDSIKFSDPGGIKPEIITYYPANHSQLINTTQQFSIKFNSAVYFVTGKKIIIREASTGNVVDTITSTGGTETDSINFMNQNAFEVGSTYYIEIDSNAFVDFYNHTYGGLYGPDQWTFTIIQPAVSDEANQAVFTIYPVPASNLLYFNIIDSLASTAKIELYEGTGKLTDVIPVENRNTTLTYDVSWLKTGFYFCKYISNTTSCTRKVLIQKI